MTKKRAVTVRTLGQRTKNLENIPPKFMDDENNTWYLLRNGNIKTNSPKAKDELKVTDNDLSNLYPLKLGKDTNGQIVFDKNKMPDKGVVDFLKAHPLGANLYSAKDVERLSGKTNIEEENTNLPKVTKLVQTFEVIDHEFEDLVNRHEIDVERQILNAISSMSEEEIVNTAYMVNVKEPHNKRFDRIFKDVKDRALEKGIQFIKDLEKVDEVRLITSKAVSYPDIIVWDGATYNYGNQTLGSTFEQVIANLKENKGMFDKSIKPTVEEKDRAIHGIQQSGKIKAETDEAKEQEPEMESEMEGDSEETEQPKQQNKGKKASNKGKKPAGAQALKGK